MSTWLSAIGSWTRIWRRLARGRARSGRRRPERGSGVRVGRHLDLSATDPELFAETAGLRSSLLLEREGARLEDYRQSDARSVHFVARSEGTLAGYVQYDPELNRLRQILVLPAFRRRGVGRLLVERVKSEAVHHGHRELRVHAWTASRAFYLGVGFQPCGEPATGEAMPWQPMSVAVERRIATASGL